MEKVNKKVVMLLVLVYIIIIGLGVLVIKPDLIYSEEDINMEYNMKMSEAKYNV